MTRSIDSAIHALVRKSCQYVVAGSLAAVGLTACSGSPLGPDDQRASMKVSATTMTATALGQMITIDAAVMTASGARIPDAGIHWDVNAPGVLEVMGDGRFRVLHEGSVQVSAVWPKDPSVRAFVTVNVNASILASACVARLDQSMSSATAKCAQRRVVVSTAPAAAMLATEWTALRPDRASQP